MIKEDNTVIEVTDGCKKFKNSKYVLYGLNMSVPKGCIYSLLGPSGCGKTTLLSCIVGLQELSHGCIKMASIRFPKDIGYMPQDNALQSVCTIQEIFYIYGLLFGLKTKLIDERLKELRLLLHLPHQNSRISNLSGGQKRRVSFAVALLHNPSTLILDEPTVGLDPLLRLTIWDYLRNLTEKECKTIIITTHYAEEAKLADKMGFMRGGKLLKEGKPSSIMQSYGSTNLEDIFVKLCYDDISSQISDNEPILRSDKGESTFNLKRNTFSFKRLRSNIYKDYLWTKRNLLLLVLLVTLPASQSYLFCLTYGHYPNTLRLGFYSEENANQSLCSYQSTFHHYYDDQDANNCSLSHSLSCQLYKNLQTKFDMVLYEQETRAYVDAKQNKIWGWVHVYPNFTSSLISRILHGIKVDDITVDQSTVDVRLDMTNSVLNYYIQQSLATSMETTLKQLAKSCNVDEAVVLKPVRIEETFYSGKDLSSSGGETVGFLSGFSFYFALILTSSALFVEKMNGVTDRNRVAGVTFMETVTGHLVIQMIMLSLQKGVMLGILYGQFDYRIHGSILSVLLGLYILESVGVSLGILFASTFEATLELNFNIVLFTLAIFFLGGIIWPEEGMHWTLQIFKWGVPGQSMVSSLRNIIVKGDSVTSPSVYIGYLTTLSWVPILAIATILIVKIKNN